MGRRRQQLLSRAAQSRLAQTMGYRVRYDGDGSAVVTLPYNAQLDNGEGALHGGILATLVDASAWYALAPYYATRIATVELQARFLAPAAGLEIRAVGRVVRAGRSIGVAEVEVFAGDGRLIASGGGSFVATSRSWEVSPAGPGAGSDKEASK